MSERFERGRARQASMRTTDTPRDAVFDHLADIAPDVARLATEFAYGDIHSRPGLDAAQRELVVLGALAALGDVDQQIESHVGSALGAGLPPRAVVEALIQTIPYVGFPRAIHALTAARRGATARRRPAPPDSARPHLQRGPNMDTSVTDTTDAATRACDRLFASIDARDWDSFEQCLASTVTTDFTGLWGGEPERATARDLRAAWATLFSGFRATQHQVGGYVVIRSDDDRLVLGATFRAAHFGEDPFGSPSWTLYGTYRIDLLHQDGALRICGLHQSPTAGEGNRNIVRLAADA